MLSTMSKKDVKFASLALPAFCALVACSVCACSDDTASEPVNKGPNAVSKSLPEVWVAEGNAFMNDPEYRAELAKLENAQARVAKRQAVINQRLQAIKQEFRNDPEAVAKIPLYRELTEKAKSNAVEFASVRREIAELIKARHARAAEDSQRVARGEAVAKKISKVEEDK